MVLIIIMESNGAVDRSVEDKVQDCVNKAVSVLATQLGKQIDDCMEKIEGRFVNRMEDEQFWSVDEVTGKATAEGSCRKVNQK